MAASRSVCVALRHVTLSESTALHELDDEVFIELDAPPPVRSLVIVSDVEGDDRRGVEITRVVEVAESDSRGACGFYGRFIAPERLEESTRVGTEHLADGDNATAATDDAEGGKAANESTTAMGQPAPVVDPDDSVRISVAETARLEAGAVLAGDEGDAEAEASAQEPESTDDDDTPRRKRRRGRKKR